MLRLLFSKFVLAIVAVLAAYFTYTHFIHPAGGGAPGGMMGAGGPPVSVAEVLSRDVQVWSEFSGKIVAADSAEVRARVNGAIEKIHFTEGQLVKKGQSLFSIDGRPYAAALQAAQARATLAEAEFRRARQLIAEKAIPQREYDQRRSEVESARAGLTQAQLNVEFSQVRAPISGRIGRAEVTVGNVVDAGGAAPVLTTIVAASPMYADFEIDEPSFLRFMQAAGADKEKLKAVPVKLMLANGAEEITGVMRSFDNRMNETSGTLRVRAEFDNADGQLVPGLLARVKLGSVAEQRVILIKDTAIKTDQSVKHVWLVDGENKVAYRPVKLGPMVDGLRVITEGLSAGDKIVVNGTQRIMMPGQPITPQVVAMTDDSSQSAVGSSQPASDPTPPAN